MKLPILLLATAGLAVCQPFGAGLKVGLPLTDFLNTVSGVTSTSTDRFVIGPMVELRLPAGVGIEFDILYRHFDYNHIVQSGTNAVLSTGHAGDWEFPLLLKYKFPSHIVRPYVEAGVAWVKLSGVTNTVGRTPGNSTVAGAVLGAGIDIHALVIHIAPELRYTRWTGQHFNVNGILNRSEEHTSELQ